MKAGIYIPGLGQSFVNESVEKYASRLADQMRYSTTGRDFVLKSELQEYSTERTTQVVSICDKENPSLVYYKLYDFRYHEILTERFSKSPLLWKNFSLMALVLWMSPLLLKRLVFPGGYSRPLQTVYLFCIFLLIALAIVVMLPSTIIVLNDMLERLNETGKAVTAATGTTFAKLSQVSLSVTALLLLVIPNANVLLPNLATEFVCASNYIRNGAGRLIIQGHLDKLVEKISETDPSVKIHFHSYSFGSVLAIDYLFPLPGASAENTGDFEALVTVGNPYEFLNSYFPGFFKKRIAQREHPLTWINVYSLADALATNFRKDNQAGDAEYGIGATAALPVNINYEASPQNPGIAGFFSLYSVRVHGMYWDQKTEGRSCLGSIYRALRDRELISVAV
ncbi:MAG TPA: hypothetical protein VF145_01015 [Chitinophagaceae bacterium]